MGRGARGCPSHQDKHQRCRILDLNISLCCFHLQPLRAGEVWDALKLHAPCTKEVLQGKERSRGRRRREQRKKKKGGCTKLITTSCPSRDGGIPDAMSAPPKPFQQKKFPGARQTWTTCYTVWPGSILPKTTATAYAKHITGAKMSRS